MEPLDAEIESTAPVCYRHPDRPTRLRCSECDRPICAECSTDAAVGQKCPVCAAPEHRTRVVTPRSLNRAGFSSAPVTFSIIAVSAALFLFGFLSEDIDRDLIINLSQFNILIEQGEWYRIFSAALLHASVMHILFNMYALYLFGPRLEQQVGSVPFAISYAAFAAAGGAAYFFMGGLQSAPAVGASGAIFGLFGVWLAATWKMRHTPAGSAMFRQLLFLLALNAALPFFVRGIAWEAHAGGFAAGLLVGFAWSQWAAGKPNAVQIRTAIAAVALLIPTIAVILL